MHEAIPARWRHAFGRISSLSHGTVLWTIRILVVQVLKRLCGITVLACMRKRAEAQAPSRARRLTAAELAAAAHDATLGPPSEFLRGTTRASRCYGVMADGCVRAYAWAARSSPVCTVSGAYVEMPRAVYVYKAFTDPRFRSSGLLGECLKAIEGDAGPPDVAEISALIEAHNRPSFRAFGRAGFSRCGFVVILNRPRLVWRVGCRAATPCRWCAAGAAATSHSRVPGDPWPSTPGNS